MLWQFPLCYNIDDFLYVVEDIAFSAFLQQQSILTYNYVPPCPRDDLEMFGIIPHKVLEYGVDMDVAVYCQSSSDKLFFYKLFMIFVQSITCKFLQDIALMPAL